MSERLVVGITAPATSPGAAIGPRSGPPFLETIAPGAFAWSIRNWAVSLDLEHSPSKHLGSTWEGTLAVEQRRDSVLFAARLGDDFAAREARALLGQGTLSASFGFQPELEEWRAVQVPDGGRSRRVLSRRVLLGLLGSVSIAKSGAYRSSRSAMVERPDGWWAKNIKPTPLTPPPFIRDAEALAMRSGGQSGASWAKHRIILRSDHLRVAHVDNDADAIKVMTTWARRMGARPASSRSFSADLGQTYRNGGTRLWATQAPTDLAEIASMLRVA